MEGSRSLPLSILRPAEGTDAVLQLNLSVEAMSEVTGMLITHSGSQN